MLDKRLLTIAQLCGITSTAADIGSDHGKLALHLLNNNQCKHVYVCDISEQSLLRAKRLFHNNKQSINATIMVSDGFSKLDGKQIDVAIIAGMGAKEIKKIIASKPPNLHVKKMICQPMKNVLELKMAVTGMGYAICDDVVVQLDRRFYHIVSFVPGTNNLSQPEFEFGENNLKTYPADFVAYLQHQLSVIQSLKHLSCKLKQKQQIITQILRRYHG